MAIFGRSINYCTVHSQEFYAMENIRKYVEVCYEKSQLFTSVAFAYREGSD